MTSNRFMVEGEAIALSEQFFERAMVVLGDRRERSCVMGLVSNLELFAINPGFARRLAGLREEEVESVKPIGSRCGVARKGVSVHERFSYKVGDELGYNLGDRDSAREASERAGAALCPTETS